MNNHKIARILLLGIFLAISLQDISGAVNFACSGTYCQDAHQQVACSAKRNCSTQGYRQYLTPEECNCCPDIFCIEYLKEDDTCNLNTNPAQVNLCGPFLTCKEAKGDTANCQLISNHPCMQERKLYTDNFQTGVVGTAQFQPQCDAGGRYAQRQCLPGSVCFCTNSQGKRLFGVGLPTKTMNCKCSKDIDMLTSVNLFDGQLPRCLSNGDYDEMQCIERKCWCRSKPDKKMDIQKFKELPCYDPALHPSKPTLYLRDCEYKKGEIEIANLKAKNSSIVLLVADVPKCDLDGTFSPLQPRNDKLVCVDSKGKQIENFQIQKNSPVANKIDCYCARIRKLMAGSVNGMPTCCKYGNFRKWQCNSSICYCVDRDGKQIVTPGEEPHEVHKDEVDKLRCYSQGDDDCTY